MHRQKWRERDDIVKGRYLYKVIFGRVAASAFIVFFLFFCCCCLRCEEVFPFDVGVAGGSPSLLMLKGAIS